MTSFGKHSPGRVKSSLRWSNPYQMVTKSSSFLTRRVLRCARAREWHIQGQPAGLSHSLDALAPDVVKGALGRVSGPPRGSSQPFRVSSLTRSLPRLSLRPVEG